MAKKTEATVEEKLRALYDLQLIDSRIDEIANVRGELPLEVEDLDDEVEGLKTRLEKLSVEQENLTQEIANKKMRSRSPKVLSKNTRNSRKTFVTTGNSTL